MACNQDKFLRLRKEFPCFVYEGFEYALSESGDFVVTFRFSCGGECFSPKHVFVLKEGLSFNRLSGEQIEVLIFNLGMIELLSYWKAFCSPRIVIRDWNLGEKELAFWRKIYFYGLGEFFFVNGISTDMESFVEFECRGNRRLKACAFDLSEAYIVPVGGGKDSVVSLDLLFGAGRDIRPFILNPRGASLDCCTKAGFAREDILEDRRSIDGNLLRLNAEGFLNGHTPFSAMLAFTCLLVSAFSGRRNIALSNEGSANESTVLGEKINHQYSKSLEFENDFRSYVAEFISPDFNYFSFLRPFSELHIAKVFSLLDYKEVFKSCNVGSKEDKWCGACPKCLFAFIILSPFMEKAELVGIFGKNLFGDKELLLYLLQLCGEEKQKPFECVGTVSEVNTAIAMRIVREQLSEDECLLHKWLELPFAKEYLQRVEQERKEGKPNELFALSMENNLSTEDFAVLTEAWRYAKMARLRRTLRGERLAVLGYGREGRSSLKLLRKLSESKGVIVADGNEETLHRAEEEERENGDVVFGKMESNVLADRTLFLKTPGIACKSIPYVPKNRISSQTDLFLQLFADRTIGISGTKGKSTTSTLIYNIIKAQRENVLLAGNIGVPLFDVAEMMNEDSIIVAELSAHQLQFIKQAPHISVLLNLYEEHLDHFTDFAEYQNAKFNLASKQSCNDYFVYNKEDERIKSLIKKGEVRSSCIGFAGREYGYAEPKFLKGEHNKANAMAALKVAEILYLDMEQAVRSIEEFKPLAHRLQYVDTVKGITYYNDSISTIPEATIAALDAIKNVDTLILGGNDRGIDYSILAKELPKYSLRNIAFTGKAGRRIAGLLNEMGVHYNTMVSDDYKDIVLWCSKVTKQGCTCLLSPAASSYDMFKNFEHRGETFTELVRELKKMD